MSTPPTRAAQEHALQLAKQAALAGKPADMVRHLHESGALDGVVVLVQREYYGTLDENQIDDCVADAVVAAYEAVQAGRSISGLVAYLVKAAKNMAADIVNSDEYRARAHVDIDSVGIPPAPDDADPRRAEAQTSAIAIARKYLPRLGQQNMQRVMTVLIDAVEKDIPDLPADDFAAATGLTAETARRLANRGLARLRALAMQDGMHLDKYQVFESTALMEEADDDPIDEE